MPRPGPFYSNRGMKLIIVPVQARAGLGAQPAATTTSGREPKVAGAPRSLCGTASTLIRRFETTEASRVLRENGKVPARAGGHEGTGDDGLALR